MTLIVGSKDALQVKISVMEHTRHQLNKHPLNRFSEPLKAYVYLLKSLIFGHHPKIVKYF
jgi:hypothetical protein